MLRTLAFLILTMILSQEGFGQNCAGVSGKKNEEKGIHYFTGMTRSEDFFTLLIQKEISLDSRGKSRYNLYLTAASKVLLADSVLAGKGVIELQLFDGSSVIYENARAYNNPLGFCCSLGFEVYLPEEEIKILAANPIVQFKAFRILSTRFALKRQKEQQRIINCLLEKR